MTGRPALDRDRRYRAKVPDDEDYRDLARLLADPSAWTSEVADHMRSALAYQREAVEACHPKDVRGRAQLSAVADDIESALRAYDSSRSARPRPRPDTV